MAITETLPGQTTNRELRRSGLRVADDASHPPRQIARPSTAELAEGARALSIPLVMLERAIDDLSGERRRIDRAIDTISTSPILTLHVLERANSEHPGSPTADLSVAITRLGTMQAADVLARLRDDARPELDVRMIIATRHAVEVATLSAQLAQRRHIDDAPTARVAGLLHDLGRELIGLVRPQLAEANYDDTDETPVMGASHADVGAWLARRAGLPDVVVRAIEDSHRADPPIGHVERVVWAAERIANAHRSSHRLEEALRAASMLGLEAGGAHAACLLSVGIERCLSPLSDEDEAPLAPRQRQVLQLLAGGARPKDIAHRLDLSSSTVWNTIAAIKRRLGVADTTQAILMAERQGWV